jgi:hypothetical protein
LTRSCAEGRVTLEGRILLHELPLEEMLLWARRHTYASASLPNVLASAGLLAEIRAGYDLVLAPDRGRGVRRRGAAASTRNRNSCRSILRTSCLA